MSEQSNEYDNLWKMIPEIWFLVHIEIQAQPQSGFEKRMFVYNYRIFDLYDHEVVSLAVLADNDPNWRPHGFRYGDFGSLTSLEFPVVKISDYDFGDSWRHDVLFEGLLVKEKGARYPKCLGGERACPPEDCGGVSGYYELLDILKDPKHEEYEEMISWLKGHFKNYHPYDPEVFKPEKVRFSNPTTRWKKAFQRD
ncbi:MAG: plasmid pRiA4b ORF-3 family protein [Desulfovermiculus sp.]|nr:plasmid pRiA4b ORF-3 family protein [Desulfovermiculus sp.]